MRHIPSPGFTLTLLPPPESQEEFTRRWDEARRTWHEQYADAIAKRWTALFAHYRVKHGDFGLLAQYLAMAHVPGFRMEAAPVGARKLWNDWEVALLRLHIEEVNARNQHLSFAQAAEHVANSHIWDIQTRDKATGGNLRRRAAAADPKLVVTYRKAYRASLKERASRSIEDFVRKWLACKSA